MFWWFCHSYYSSSFGPENSEWLINPFLSLSSPMKIPFKILSCWIINPSSSSSSLSGFPSFTLELIKNYIYSCNSFFLILYIHKCHENRHKWKKYLFNKIFFQLLFGYLSITICINCFENIFLLWTITNFHQLNIKI